MEWGWRNTWACSYSMQIRLPENPGCGGLCHGVDLFSLRVWTPASACSVHRSVLLHGLRVTASPFLDGFSPKSSLPCSGMGMFLLSPSLECWIPPAPVALCWQELGLGPSPAPAWVVSKPWERLGIDGDMQCSFMIDQINSETISSVSRQCSSLYKASVFCPKSRYF